MIEREINIKYTVFSSIEEMNEDDVILLENARAASNNSYSPYSNFSVGAAVKLSNGKIIKGSNQENAAYPAGLCAERVALFYAASDNPNDSVVSLAISARKGGEIVTGPISPCGSCRQVIKETEVRFGNKIRILLDGSDCIYLISGIENLLPLSFSNNDL
ncbi:MAG: cytidine deaminase [Prolixibacteraceae bacterium]|nr:cytidine deaminase [Prolixibacteraceae bacterium]